MHENSNIKLMCSQVEELNIVRCMCCLSSSIKAVSPSVLSDSATPQTVACQAPLSMEFSRQEFWSGLPYPPPEDLPNPGIEPWSSALQADSSPFELQGSPMRVKSGYSIKRKSESNHKIALYPSVT